jgi:hypothetical protein
MNLIFKVISPPPTNSNLPKVTMTLMISLKEKKELSTAFGILGGDSWSNQIELDQTFEDSPYVPS